MVDDDLVELTIAADRHCFRRGIVHRLRMRTDGSLRAETWRDRWTDAIAEVFRPRESFVVTHIDHERGTITVGDR